MVRIAGIGLGYKGSVELQICSKLDEVEIVAGADISRKACESFEDEFSVPAYEKYEELLDRHAAYLDAALITSPHTLHHEQTMACFEHGMAVFLEKPITTTIEHAVDLVETAAERDLVFQIGYQRHFHPTLQDLRQRITTGEIGDIHMVYGYLQQDWIGPQQGTWRTDPRLSGGGQLYDSGSHLLDILLWVTDTQPATVAATIDYQGHEVDVNTALAATLERDQGPPVTASIGISGAGSAFPNTSDRLVVLGTEGEVEYVRNLTGEVEANVVHKQHEETPMVESLEVETEFGELTEIKLKNFIDAIQNNGEPAVPGEFGLQVTALTESIRLAHERERTVSVIDEIEQARKERTPSSE